MDFPSPFLRGEVDRESHPRLSEMSVAEIGGRLLGMLLMLVTYAFESSPAMMSCSMNGIGRRRMDTRESIFQGK